MTKVSYPAPSQEKLCLPLLTFKVYLLLHLGTFLFLNFSKQEKLQCDFKTITDIFFTRHTKLDKTE